MLGLRSTSGAVRLVPSAVESATEGAVCHESDVSDVCEEKRGCGGAFAFVAIAEGVAQSDEADTVVRVLVLMATVGEVSDT